jgi:PhzF family phenazine biosynthesis protein
VREVLRLAAFSDDPRGGNPAGVVLDATGLTKPDMLRIAADVGYSETAFLVPAGDRTYDMRYFSSQAEVSFCGHATIASGVLLGPGEWVFRTGDGDVRVQVSPGDNRLLIATLTSVSPRVDVIADDHLTELLASLGWTTDELDPTMPPRVAYAGAHHPIIAARNRDRLGQLDYHVDRLRTLMLARNWTTIDLVWRESASVFHARNPFPVGGVYEDPATGAAAAGFGAYLRELELVQPPVTVTVLQGAEMGRPSTIRVELRRDDDRVRVSGTAVHIPPGDGWRPRVRP